MAVIKGHNSATLLKDALVLDLGDVSRQAQRIVAAAEAKARRLIADAQRDAMAYRKQIHDDSATRGYQEGFEKGLEAGRQQGRQEAYQQTREQLQRLEQSWAEAIGQWDDQHQAMQRDARQAVLELAVRFAVKLTHRVVEVDHQAVLGQVEAVLSQVLRPMEVTVHICPDDRQVLEEAMPQLLAKFTQIQRIRLADDPQVGRGGCVLSYGQGRIDATIQTQIRRVVELLMPGRVDDLVNSEDEHSDSQQAHEGGHQPPQDHHQS